MKVEGSYSPYPSVVFSKELREPCSYVHSETGGKCVNTNDGHVKGHQSVNGGFLANGGFVVGDFNVDRLLGLVNNCVAKILKDINKDVESSRETRRLYAVDVRLLSFDGGAVGGIIRLSILARLELLINLDISFSEYFYLIVGVGTGGLVALGPGAHNFSFQECITCFKALCENGFENERGARN
ncbi:hypothetical protein CDV36_010518 [Fusarium kuroshium]|uniref:PNPLA domain-containing protein n=2 Tax=Fusarium solani species complex TaxID=232080 RepID=A0A3M2RX47_9HYPO|nr:hypothetical protein CDV36_010518 [Fusarium kuroshium]RSL87471.1 hypothetical protein CEP52_015527 [Fusarium oligoseptatum]